MSGELIYERMAEVSASVQGVAQKAAESDRGGVRYAYRHMEDIVSVLKEPMSKAKIFVTPKVEDHQRSEYEAQSGTTMQLSLMLVRFTFYTEDGSSVDVLTVGEAADSSDKAANKAMTAALKYALLHTFLIPTSDSDQDAERPEAPAKGAGATPTSHQQRKPGGMGGRHIHEGMAKKLLYEARQRGEKIGMHGHEVMNHVLSLGKLTPAPTRAKHDEVIEHLCNTVPNEKRWMDWLLGQISAFSPPEEEEPPPPGDNEGGPPGGF